MVSYNKSQKTRGHEKSISLYQNKTGNSKHVPLSRERVLISGPGSGLESASGFIQHSSLTEQKSQGVQKTRGQIIASDIPSTSPNSQALISKVTRRSNNGIPGANVESPIDIHENINLININDTRNSQNKQNTREDSQRRALLGMDAIQYVGSFSNQSQSPLIFDNFSMSLHADPDGQLAAFGSTLLFEGDAKDGKGQYLLSQDGTIGSPDNKERAVDKHKRNLSFNKGIQSKQKQVHPGQFSRYNH